MTGKTHRSQRGAGEATRLQDLLRADAAAVIDDDLDDETLDEDTPLGAGGSDDSAPAAQHPRSQVYSIRVPVERLEQVRRLAKERGVAPTVMLREWVLAQLDSETGAGPRVSDHVSPQRTRPRVSQSDPAEQRSAVIERAEATTAAFVDIAAQMAKTLELLTQLAATQSTTTARSMPNPRALPLYPSILPAESPQGLAGPRVLERIWAASSAWPVPTVSMQLTIGHVHRGVAELRSTVESVSGSRGISDDDLDTLYMAADEELSNP